MRPRGENYFSVLAGRAVVLDEYLARSSFLGMVIFLEIKIGLKERERERKKERMKRKEMK